MSSRRASGWSRAACTGWRRRWPASPSERGAPSATAPRSPRSWSAAGAAAGVRLASGERLAADAVVINARCRGARRRAARQGRGRRASPAVPRAARSLSAVTWSLVGARPTAFRSSRHNVFFSDDYQAEFDAVFARRPPAGRAHRLRLRPGPRRPAAPSRRRARSGCSASSTRRPRATPHTFTMRRSRHARSGPSRGWRRCGLRVDAAAGGDGGDDADGLRPAVPGDGRGALRAGLPRLDGVVPAGRGRGRGCRASIWRGAARIRGRGCRWRRCRAGRRRPACWRTSLRPAGRRAAATPGGTSTR